MKSISMVFLLALGANSSFASIMPENNLHLSDNPLSLANMTEQEFNAVIDKVIAIWQPIAKMHGADLVANKLWSNSTVNASAEQTGNKWEVNMYGGLARRKEITMDGFTLVICHELGHHFAGYPVYDNNPWYAANEGQSDYFATQYCARRLWSGARNFNSQFRNAELPVSAKEKCDAIWKDADSQNLCYRTALAGKSLADLLGALDIFFPKKPDFDKPDTKQVAKTSHSHPNAQCRLDTYFSGALCPAGFDGNRIPGKSQAKKNDIASEEEAAKVSCTEKAGFKLGFRPRCWFKPLI